MISVKLDGKMTSLLDFRQPRIEALSHIARGEKILWELDLGLFTGLVHPFGNESEARAMLVAIDHFLKSLWSEFEPYTVGLCLYRGSFDFDPALFGDYLKFLTVNIPDRLPVYIFFETSEELNLEHARKSSCEFFPRFEIRINNQVSPFVSMDTKLGFLLPSNGDVEFQQLIDKSLSIRVIPEQNLVSEWDGLDVLIVDAPLVSKEGLRKLRGFCAAGGRVVYLGHPLELPDEMSFDRELTFLHF